MRRVIKYLVSVTFRPALVRYLAQTRTYRYRNIVLQVPPEVFHPGFFFSTKMLLRYLATLPLRGRDVLELGAGSGLISIAMAQAGARVTATDINPVALEQLRENAAANDVSIDIVRADLFEGLEGCVFDVVAINPPYYKGIATSAREQAWYCGPNGEYFERLFVQLGRHVHAESEVLLVLSDGCDIDLIRLHAAASGYRLRCAQKRANLMETNYIFKVEKVDA